MTCHQNPGLDYNYFLSVFIKYRSHNVIIIYFIRNILGFGVYRSPLLTTVHRGKLAHNQGILGIPPHQCPPDSKRDWAAGMLTIMLI